MTVISKEHRNLYHNRLTVIAAHKLDEDILTGHVVVLRWKRTLEELRILFFNMLRACVQFYWSIYL